jgi:cytochrome c oxidase subunit II
MRRMKLAVSGLGILWALAFFVGFNSARAQTRTEEFKMTARKYSFDPGRITVKRGDRVRLLITAVDHDHGFQLEGYAINRLLKKGDTVVIEFNADKAGTFHFQCSHFCGLRHYKMGGELVVED